jgi:hypothetical protein
MTSLKYLDLFGNDFHGPVPASFGKLRKLEKLCIEDNQLTGPLPVDFGNHTRFPQLFSLDISRNPGLTGTVTQVITLFATGTPAVKFDCCGKSIPPRPHIHEAPYDVEPCDLDSCVDNFGRQEGVAAQLHDAARTYT